MIQKPVAVQDRGQRIQRLPRIQHGHAAQIEFRRQHVKAQLARPEQVFQDHLIARDLRRRMKPRRPVRQEPPHRRRLSVEQHTGVELRKRVGRLLLQPLADKRRGPPDIMRKRTVEPVENPEEIAETAQSQRVAIQKQGPVEPGQRQAVELGPVVDMGHRMDPVEKPRTDLHVGKKVDGQTRIMGAQALGRGASQVKIVRPRGHINDALGHRGRLPLRAREV